MYKCDLPVDTKDLAAIERRRNKEQQRQSRIFNTKYRTMGVDVLTLERQMHERRTIEKREKAREDALDVDRRQCATLALMMEQRENEITRELEKEMQKFREDHQQAEYRRDFDLYDPEGLKKDRPARVCDLDPRCGVSSLQKFAGEDLNQVERKKFQKENSNRWLDEQKLERQTINAQKKQADNLFDLKRIELDQRAVHLGRMEDDCRKALNMAMSSFNQAMAIETSVRKEQAHQREEDYNFAEIYNNLAGDILSENPDAAVSSFGPHRVVTDRWKGMSPEQVRAILEKREQQRLERQKLDEEERLLNTEWDKQRTVAARAAINMEHQEGLMTREIRKKMDDYNQQLSQAQREKLEYLNKVVYTNNPTAHYHSQFNASSR